MISLTAETYSEALKKCRLFAGIPECAYSETLRYLHAKQKVFKKGEIVLDIGSESRSGLVLSGKIECSYQDEAFNKFNMNHLGAGYLFGENMVCAGIEASPMQVIAVSDCTIMFLDLGLLYDSESVYKYRAELLGNLLRILSAKNIFLNQKVRILSTKSLRDRIICYLQTLPSHAGKTSLPFSKTALAEFLCVNRTALSRELSRMQSEGIITMNGREFVLCSLSVSRPSWPSRIPLHTPQNPSRTSPESL